MQDDRGEKREVLNPAGFQDWPVRGDPRMEHLVQRLGFVLKGRPGVRGLLKMAMLSLVPLTVAVMAVIVGRSLLVGMGAPRWLPFVIICVVSSLCGPIVTHWLKRGNEDQVADLLLEEGLCPCCGYNLHGIAAASDHRIVCSECGAAWNAARVMRTEPFKGTGNTVSIKQILGSMQASNSGWNTVDAKGRRVQLAPARLRRSLRSAKEHPPWHERLVSARRGIRRGCLATRMLGLAIVWSLALGIVGAMIYAIMRQTGPGVGALVFAAVPMIGLVAWATFGNFCFRPKVVRAELIAEGLCPSCARPLDDAEVADPAMATCLNCRSAWTLDEMEAAARRKSPRAAEQEAVVD